MLMSSLVQRYLTVQVQNRDIVPSSMSDLEPLERQVTSLQQDMKQLTNHMHDILQDTRPSDPLL